MAGVAALIEVLLVKAEFPVEPWRSCDQTRPGVNITATVAPFQFVFFCHQALTRGFQHNYS